jgi:hypothetical protein
MDYPRSDLASVFVFIEPAPELLELELVDGAPVAPGACVAPLPPDWVTAGVAGLSAGAAGAADGGVYCAIAAPITPAVAMVAAAVAKNFVLVMHFSFSWLNRFTAPLPGGYTKEDCKFPAKRGAR